jgi:hypothetical protein
MRAVPEGITSADVIVWGEGGTFAQQIAAGRHRLKNDEPESAGGTDSGPPSYDFLLAAQSCEWSDGGAIPKRFIL